MSNEQLEKLAAEVSIADLVDNPEPQEQIIAEENIIEPQESEEKPITFNKPLSEMTDEEVAAYAKTLGWSPLEEFRGDKSRWTDARAFAEKSENMTPVLRENLRRQAEKLAQNDEKMAKVATNFAKHQQLLVKTYEKQIAELEAKIKDAYGVETPETFNKMMQEKQELQAAVQDIKYNPVADDQNELLRWKAENPWFGIGVNPQLEQAVRTVEAMIQARTPNISNKEYVAQLDAQLESLAAVQPALFVGTKYLKKPDVNNMASPVTGGVQPRANTVQAKKTFTEKDLSPEDREVYNFLKGSLPEKDRLELLQTYSNNY